MADIDTQKPDLAQGIDSQQLAPDRPLAGQVAGEDVVLVRHQGRLCALAATCTHLGAPLAKGLVADGELRCPWHHARFSLDSGEATGAPALLPLARFDVVEEEGRIRVTGKTRTESPGQPSPIRDPGRVVIVGGGAAGHACADMLARLGLGGQVTVLSADADAPYDRTYCSKQYLAGKKTRADALLPPPGLEEGPAPSVRTATEVLRLDLAAHRVHLAGGESVHFDTLVLATGAEPVVPPFAGHDRDDVHRLRTLADADRLIDAAGRAKTAVVVGASYIGLEAAASLTQRGVTVHVVAEGDVPLAKTAGPEVGELVQRLHEAKGVTFHLGREVKGWDGKAATLDDGTVLAGDLLVAGTGVKPRLELARGAGLTIAGQDAGGGVQVNAQLQTSAANVYAIGDIASYPDAHLGAAIRVEHWVVAQRMGQWLGRYLAGAPEAGASYADLPFFWSGHYDTSLRYVGHVSSPDDRRLDGSVADKDVAVTFLEHGQPHALLTCGRDLAALETEAAWEGTHLETTP